MKRESVVAVLVATLLTGCGTEQKAPVPEVFIATRLGENVNVPVDMREAVKSFDGGELFRFKHEEQVCTVIPLIRPTPGWISYACCLGNLGCQGELTNDVFASRVGEFCDSQVSRTYQSLAVQFVNQDASTWLPTVFTAVSEGDYMVQRVLNPSAGTAIVIPKDDRAKPFKVSGLPVQYQKNQMAFTVR